MDKYCRHTPSLRTPGNIVSEYLSLHERAILPAVLLALAGYLISLIVGLYGTKSQARTKFLELWSTASRQDDMALEVTVRHGFGTYIPASIIKRACRLDNCAD